MHKNIFSGCAAAAALAAVLGVSACGGSAAPAHTASPTPTATKATPTATGTAEAAVKGIPFYQPSTVRTHTAHSATLTSPDSVTKVNDYYLKVAERDGWTTVSKSFTGHSGHLTLKKSGEGATIAVAPSGSGSLITISAYRIG